MGLIHTKVDDFLQSHSYDFTAVPHNYTVERPLSMQAVNSNLLLVQQILRCFNALQTKAAATEGDTEIQKDLQFMINELKLVIYAALDEFVCKCCSIDALQVSKTEVVCMDYFNIEEEYSFDSAVIYALLKLTEDKMDKKMAENIKRAMKDMEVGGS